MRFLSRIESDLFAGSGVGKLIGWVPQQAMEAHSLAEGVTCGVCVSSGRQCAVQGLLPALRA